MTKSDRPSKPTVPTADQQLFMSTMISLSWQLLIVVVVPFVGGHWLDGKLHKTPLFTLLGLGLALALATLVTYSNYQILLRAHKENTK